MSDKASVLTSMALFLCPEVAEGGAYMLFTEGKDRNYERMMQEKPGFKRDRRRMVSPNARQRDCPHCLYYNETLKKCGLATCVVFKK